MTPIDKKGCSIYNKCNREKKIENRTEYRNQMQKHTVNENNQIRIEKMFLNTKDAKVRI